MISENAVKNKPAVVILAAGNSSRFGKPKPLLAWDNDRIFLQHILDVYTVFGCPQIRVVLNAHLLKSIEKLGISCHKNMEFVLNEHPEYERFYSLQCGLKQIPERTPCFVQNADQPFIDVALLQALYDHSLPEKLVVPVFQNRSGHPVLLSPEIVNNICREENFTTNLRDFLQAYEKIKVICTHPGIHADIDTPEDYNLWFNHLNLTK